MFKKVFLLIMFVITAVSFVLAWNMSCQLVSMEEDTFCVTGVFCDDCNNELDPGNIPEHCSECGSKNKSVNVTFDKCMECGNKYSMDTYCARCGSRLLINMTEDELHDRMSKSNNSILGIVKKSTVRNILFVLIFIYCMSCIAACSYKKKF